MVSGHIPVSYVTCAITLKPGFYGVSLKDIDIGILSGLINLDAFLKTNGGGILFWVVCRKSFVIVMGSCISVLQAMCAFID